MNILIFILCDVLRDVLSLTRLAIYMHHKRNGVLDVTWPAFHTT